LLLKVFFLFYKKINKYKKYINLKNNKMEAIYTTCFICNKKIDATKLTLHLNQCNKKIENNLLISEGSLIQKYNKFKEENQKYKEYCEIIKESKKPIKNKRLPGQRPRTIHCPLCDIEFSIGARKIHIKRCREKKIENLIYYDNNKIKEIDELINNTMKRIEGINSISNKIKSKGKYDIDNLGNDAYDIPQNLIICSSCGRSFIKDKIEKHQNICFKHPELFRKK
jgi:hypothetical protein